MRIDLGTVSQGTLRDEDLIPCFTEHLAALTGAAIDAHEINGRTARRLFGLCSAARLYHSLAYDARGDLIDELSDALNEFAPDGCYFGAHEGDGADFGFWPRDVHEMEREGDCLVLGELPSAIAVVSDHGNITYYRIEARELWSVV